MFSALYEPCLENIFLARLANNLTKTEMPIITLGDVIRSSHYVLFLLFRSSYASSVDVIEMVKNFVTHKNGNLSRKNSSTSSPAKLKKLFGLKKKKKSAITDKMSVVIVDLEPNVVDFNLCEINEPGFYFFPDSQQYTTKSRLLRALNFTGIAPSVIVVDSTELVVKTTQGRRMLLEDPSGDQFPWTDPAISDVFKGKFLRKVQKSVDSNKPSSSTIEYEDFSTFKPCVKGLYFGAKWYPPCRVISKQLASFYERIKSKNLNFEIFFCSSDRTEESFIEHFLTMPWLSFPFDSVKLSQLTRAFDINGIPSFILLDENNQFISRNGRSLLMSDSNFKNFPWKRSLIYELNEFTVHRIADYTSLILFTGSPDDNEFSKQILKPCAEVLYSQIPNESFLQTLKLSFNGNNKDEVNLNQSQQQFDNSVEVVGGAEISNSDLQNDDHSVDSVKSIPAWADPLQVFYTGEDPICDFILDSIGQGQADLPLLVICDVLAGHMAICDKPDVSESIVSEFVSDYRRGKANVISLPSLSLNGLTVEEKRVGGVPVNLIEQIMHNQQQQQQQQQSLQPSTVPPTASSSA